MNRAVNGITAMRHLACLRCEGSGVVRHYLNRGGEYETWHCPTCGGTGQAEYAEPTLRAEVEKRRFEEYERQRAAAKAARAAQPSWWAWWKRPDPPKTKP